ncbi:hypothetical protein [Streptomyces sp. SP18CS02]|uniref:hypothetical protein n=1 Tax=Streptomyces sp. SP18CS02 TaxID=3002531 RepID=UPI002E7AAD57|nr:hypothetical protein [Streptomyces sp. SP18CS02]MEE1756515.1 hypothetical protein [Streptomyces sp. SP18CS02]
MALRPLRRSRKNPTTVLPAPAAHPAHAPATSRWLLLGKDGRLNAYAATDGGLLCWTERRPGGPEWSQPLFFEMPDIEHFTVAQGPNGYVHLVVQRRSVRDDGLIDVGMSHTTQYQSGRRTTPWHPLGCPFADTEHGGSLAQPAATVDNNGSLYALPCNPRGRVSLRAEKRDGKWGGWVELPGDGSHESLTAFTTKSGKVQVVAVGEGTVQHWAQTEPGGEVEPASTRSVCLAAGSVTPLESAPDRISLYGTDAKTGELVVHRPGGDTVALGISPAAGSMPAAVRTVIDGHDCTVIAVRGQDGRLSVAACPTGAEESGAHWSATGDATAGAPAMALDDRGRVVVAAIGTDGTLRVTRQKPEPGLALEAWSRV